MAAGKILSRLQELLVGDGTACRERSRTARQRAAEESRWEQILRSGEQTVVDHLAPSVLVEEPDCFQVGGDVWGRAYFVADLPPGMVLNVETVLRFAGDTWWSWFIYPEPETEIHPALKHRRTTLYGRLITTWSSRPPYRGGTPYRAITLDCTTITTEAAGW